MRRLFGLLLLLMGIVFSSQSLATMNIVDYGQQYDVSYVVTDYGRYGYDTSSDFRHRHLTSLNEKAQKWPFLAFVSDFLAAKSGTTVIGRVKDLQKLKKGEQSLLNRLPDRGSAKANWKQNSGVIRQEISKGKPIRDASPGDKRGQFLNAERYLLESRGWTFDKGSSFWNPPKP